MPNGSYVLGVYTENDIESWRDLIFYIAQVLVLPRLTALASWKLTKYGNTPVADIPDTQRFSSSFRILSPGTRPSPTNVRTQDGGILRARPR